MHNWYIFAYLIFMSYFMHIVAYVAYFISEGGTHNIGYDAVRWENILHGDCGEYGRYHELSVLPDKIARYLFEFNSDSYASLHLPEIPKDRSQDNIHALMNPPHVLHRILFVHVLALIYI